MRVCITGGCGICGTALVALPHERVFLDCRGAVPALAGNSFFQTDLSQYSELVTCFRECDAVIHLAGSSAVESSWEEVLTNNIEGTRNVVQAASDARVERVIFASSNHAVGMYEIENAPRIYELDHGLKIGSDCPPMPDSYYGISKVFGEATGRYFAENSGPKFYALRIGSVRAHFEDHPFAYAERGVAERQCSAEVSNTCGRKRD